ncbi:GDT1-like protein 1- chloroplastic [Striga hermonthica]|uniref:GDT1 family protein n=1 Tax=Striga hermonthica TaxID=68872 RepID=A0A9N7RPC6_STRHE|nr:GDT1-like protein 1- chloroplastic [Striga hermonthica]
MVYILSGVHHNSLPRTCSADPHNNPCFAFHLPDHFHFTRKLFAGKPSYSSKLLDKELMTSKEKHYNHKLLVHATKLGRSPRKHTSFGGAWNKYSTLLDDRPQNAQSLGHLKLMLMCGFFTLQTTQQALAGADVRQSFSFLGDVGDISTGFASAFLLIFFSELGDKTFFIAALLAAKNSAVVTFIGTFGALGVMTIISVIVGRTFHYVDDILPFRLGDADLPIDDIAAVCLLVYFGVSSLLEASSSEGLKLEEEQKEAELAVSELSGSGAGILSAANTVLSTFLLVFVAEWGDKSFFSTIALAAASSPLGVIAGALAGHGVATLLAVLGGSFMGTYLSEKVIAYIGGVLFLVFAAITLIEIVS